MKTITENPKGLHRKYRIQKYKSVKHEFMGLLLEDTIELVDVDPNSEYFVLRLDNGGSDPKHIEACRIGVNAYANAIKDHLPELAKDLIERYPIEQPQPLSTEVEECSVCGGDGKETCNNPDHGFIGAMGGDIGRIGCPCCGHDPNHKVKNGGKCDHCNGTGIEPSTPSIKEEKVSTGLDELIEWMELEVSDFKSSANSSDRQVASYLQNCVLAKVNEIKEQLNK